MLSFREQMQRLANEIERTRNERKAFVQRNQKYCEKLRDSNSKKRVEVRREIGNRSTQLAKSLHEFQRRNKSLVASILRETRHHRMQQTRVETHGRKQVLSKIRRHVERLLRTSQSERTTSKRRQDREVRMAIQSIKGRVHRLRSGTNRQIRMWAKDRLDARQIWSRIHSQVRAAGFTERLTPIPVASGRVDVRARFPLPTKTVESAQFNTVVSSSVT
jgi:hypothetical protein